MWCLVEVIFFAVQRLRYHRLNKVNEARPSAADVDERFHQFLTLASVLDIRDFISGWFLNIPFSEIRAGNVADFIAYAYWCALSWLLSRGFSLLQCTLGNSLSDCILSVATVLCYIRVGRVGTSREATCQSRSRSECWSTRSSSKTRGACGFPQARTMTSSSWATSGSR